MIRVEARNGEPLEKTIRRFKKRCEKEGLTKDIKKNMYYDKPSEVRRRESRKLEKRILQERIEAKAALAKIETAVASNPAFADAGAQGSEAPAADGSPAGEPVAAKTFEQWHAEYVRVRENEGPVAAAEFRAKHKSELRLG